jgi:hypothetical protein
VEHRGRGVKVIGRGGVADGGFKGWCPDICLANGVQVEEPFKVIVVDSKAGPAEAL